MQQPPERLSLTSTQRNTGHLNEAEDRTLRKPSTSQLKQQRRRTMPLSIVLAFLLGIMCTLLLLFAAFLVLSPDRSISNVSQLPVSKAITVQVSREYLTQVVQKQLKTSGLPGTISNVQVALGQDNLVTISGDDQFTVLGLGVTKHFTLVVQLSVSSCQLHARVTHADLAGIPVTGYAATFENQINQQLQSQVTGLPQGFTYCVTGVQTASDQVTLVYAATSS